MKLKTFFWLLLTVLLWPAGCRTLPPAPPPVAVISSEELLARLNARQEQVKSFQAKGRITFLSPKQNYSGMALLTGQLPALSLIHI